MISYTVSTGPRSNSHGNWVGSRHGDDRRVQWSSAKHRDWRNIKLVSPIPKESPIPV